MAVHRTAEEEVQRLRELEERIKAPSIWGRVPCGIRFEDLQEKRYEAAVRILKKHYLREDVLYKSVKLHEDKEGTDEFIHNARIWMKDKMSIAAVKEGTDQLVGMVLMRIQEKSGFSRTFSRIKITHNPLYTSVREFLNILEKPCEIFKEYDVRRYMKIYVIALKFRYRHRGIGIEMLKAAVACCKAAQIPVVMGIMTTASLQNIADKLGFVKLNEIYYIRYLVEELIVFWDTGIGNYGAAVMALRIPDVIEPPEELKPQYSARFSVQKEEKEDEED